MAFPPPYGTASSRTHNDPHRQFASNNVQPTLHDDARVYWYGNEPAIPSCHSPNRPSSSSSLAGALDEEASKLPRRPTAAYSFPESEVVPVATPLPRSIATLGLQASADAPCYLDSQLQQYRVHSPDEYCACMVPAIRSGVHLLPHCI